MRVLKGGKRMSTEYKFVDPDVTCEQMVEVLVKGLNRKLTDQEIRKIYWIGDTESETRGVLLDLFKELTGEIENLKNSVKELQDEVKEAHKR